MATTKLSFSRTHLIAMARVHHVLFAFAGLYYGGSGGAWEGNAKKGSYVYDDNQGNRVILAWQKDMLVGLVFDHESERSEYDEDEDDRRPLRWLKGLPARVRPFATKTAADFENLATSGVFADGEEVTLSDPVRPRSAKHGLHLVAGFGLEAEEAIFGATLLQNWLELSSLEEGHARLALRIARESEKGAVRLRPADSAQLLVLPKGRETIDRDNARQTQKDLAAVGIAWTIPTKKLAELEAKKKAADTARVEAALSPDERRLFEAARSNDAREAKATLARGANVDVRTVDGQWQYTPAGDTPLIQACKKSAKDVALFLLAAGADPNATNRFGQSGLLWAARSKLDDVVAACLAAGADPNLADDGGEAPLLHAAQNGEVATVDRLLAAGARPDTRTRSGVTAADRASFHGHHDLARRLRAASSST
jgi:hypothetical protein